uniref:Cysteine/serine-rich nuclear protein N-terminal domain-containing protein n=1 Tax=Clastoptera arizonana TaxID=38151 RepID=A0A1B6DRP7_9HEMI
MDPELNINNDCEKTDTLEAAHVNLLQANTLSDKNIHSVVISALNNESKFVDENRKEGGIENITCMIINENKLIYKEAKKEFGDTECTLKGDQENSKAVEKECENGEHNAQFIGDDIDKEVTCGEKDKVFINGHLHLNLSDDLIESQNSVLCDNNACEGKVNSPDSKIELDSLINVEKSILDTNSNDEDIVNTEKETYSDNLIRNVGKIDSNLNTPVCDSVSNKSVARTNKEPNSTECNEDVLVKSNLCDVKILSNNLCDFKENFESPCSTTNEDIVKNVDVRIEKQNTNIDQLFSSPFEKSSIPLENFELKQAICDENVFGKKYTDSFSLSIFETSNNHLKTLAIDKTFSCEPLNSELKCPFITNSYQGSGEISKTKDFDLNLRNSCAITSSAHLTPDLQVYPWKNQVNFSCKTDQDCSKVIHFKEPLVNNFPTFVSATETKEIFEFVHENTNNTQQSDLSCNFFPASDVNKNNLIGQQFLHCVSSENHFPDLSFESKQYNGLGLPTKNISDQNLDKQSAMGAVVSSVSNKETNVGQNDVNFTRKIEETLLAECPPDGSDSGLGCELADDRIVVQTDSLSSEELNTPTTSDWTIRPQVSYGFEIVKPELLSEMASPSCAFPLKSNLKRSHSSLKTCETPSKRVKKSITFDNVSVFYFPRVQGFTCVPSQGGSTLGMSWTHSHERSFTLSEHATEQRRLHRHLIAQLRSTSTLPASSSSESDTDDQRSESEMDLDNYYFLQPVPTRQRRALLRAAGVHKIDSLEKDDCKDIRRSREFCGCSCKAYCDPDTCSCSQAGIKCQVRSYFIKNRSMYVCYIKISHQS